MELPETPIYRLYRGQVTYFSNVLITESFISLGLEVNSLGRGLVLEEKVLFT